MSSPATRNGHTGCTPGYLDDAQVKRGVLALKKYMKFHLTREDKPTKAKNLLEAGEEEKSKLSGQIIVTVVFKNIPANSKTYIHNIVLPHHWRLTLEPEDCDIAVFVPHKKPTTEAQRIQFEKDRDLDIENTHAHYQNLFLEKLDEPTRARISRLITSKELATEFNTFQKIDRLAKTYDLFLGDKKLMANKFNALPRRLGRRFWVREKKVPIMIKLGASDLKERFQKALSTEPFYVIGKSSTERIQLGLLSQKTSEVVANIKTFLHKLHELYGDQVRFIKLQGSQGFTLPIFADLSTECPKEVKMIRKRITPKPIIGDFDLLPGNAKIKVHASGDVKVVRNQTKTKRKAPESPVEVKSKKRARK